MNKELKQEVLHTYVPYKATKGRSQNFDAFFGKSTREMAFAREGFYFISESFEQEKGRKPKFLVPRFICRDVPDTLQQLNLQFEYYEVGEDLQVDVENLKSKVNNFSPDFVVLVNYFGFPADLQKVNEAIGDKVVIVEDNAHGFLSKDSMGTWLGTRTEWGLFSIRKSFPLENGALLLRNKGGALSGRKGPYLQESMRVRIKNIVRSIIPIVGASNFVSLLQVFRKPVEGAPSVGPFHPETPVDIKFQLQEFDHARSSDNRRNLFIHLLERSKSLGVNPIFDRLPEGTIPYGFPFVCVDPENVVHAKLKALGLEAFKWPELNEDGQKLDPFFKNIWLVRFMW